jgi:hypothetical protein
MSTTNESGAEESGAATPEPGALGAPPRGAVRPHRFLWLYVLPLIALLVAAVLPLIRGTETLYLRDVLNAHLEMKWAQAIALRHGSFPLIDTWRAGGQPLAGNPNAVPFYPTNLLYLAGSSIFWAFNAHFWIHLLAAPFAFFWFARRCGLGREAAWAAAACYTLSGFFLSHLSFYNLIAGATLAPAFAAACLSMTTPGPRTRWTMPPIVAILWALLLLGGEPLLALLGALLAAAALAMFWRPVPPARRGPTLALLAAAGIAGSLLALPQIVEFLRILPFSHRGYWGYNALLASVASWDPRQMGEWFLPLVFGRVDILGPGSFWGDPYFTDTPPLYLSLYPGLLSLSLVAISGWRRAAHPALRRFAWSLAAVGIFFSLGRFNPLLSLLANGIDALAGLHPALAFLHHLSGGSLVRYPVKLWLPVAVGGALLCGLGFDRLLRTDSAEIDPWRRLRLALVALGGLYLIACVFLSARAPAALALLRRIIPSHLGPGFVANERARWTGLCLLSLVVVAALLVCTAKSVRPPGQAATAGGLLLIVHAIAQLLLLHPLYPTDAVMPYRVPPPALASLPLNERVVNPDLRSLFGRSRLASGRFPDHRSLWLERRAFYELYPASGPLWRRHFELSESPEGLDSFLTYVGEEKLKRANNDERFRLLAAWGVGRLIIDRPLVPPPAGAQLIARIPDFGQELAVYAVTQRAPEAALARRAFYAPSVNDSTPILTRPDFVPGEDVVVPGSGPPRALGGGTVRVLSRGPEQIELDAAVDNGGSILVVQRAILLWEATIDGQPAAVIAANLHRVGVAVPAGRHRIRLYVDHAPLHRSLWGALVGLLALPVLAIAGRRAA